LSFNAFELFPVGEGLLLDKTFPPSDVEDIIGPVDVDEAPVVAEAEVAEAEVVDAAEVVVAEAVVVDSGSPEVDEVDVVAGQIAVPKQVPKQSISLDRQQFPRVSLTLSPLHKPVQSICAASSQHVPLESLLPNPKQVPKQSFSGSSQHNFGEELSSVLVPLHIPEQST